MIRVDCFDDYEAVIVGRLARKRDCRSNEVALTEGEQEHIRLCWRAGISYPTAFELMETAQ